MLMERFKLWDDIGKDVSSQNNITNVITSANMDWEVEKRSVYVDGTEVLGHKAVVRTDTNSVLGMVTDRYEIVQNYDAFSFVDSLDDFEFEKAGEFNGGKKLYVVGKYTGNNVNLTGKDDVDFYMTFITGHGGHSCIRAILSPVRMFCMNQLNLMLDTAKFKYEFQHSSTVHMRMAQASNVLSMANNYIESFGTESMKLMTTPMSDSQVESNIVTLANIKENDTKRVLTRKEEMVSSIQSIYKHTPDLQNYRRTAFGFINAVSDYVSHKEPSRKTDTYKEGRFMRTINNNTLVEEARMLVA